MSLRAPAVVLVAALVGACAGEQPDDAAANERAGTAFHETAVAAEHLGTWSRLIMAGVDESLDLSGDPTTRAATLLSELDLRLRNHVVMVAHATDAHIDDRETTFEAAVSAVEQNRTVLADRLTELYDAELVADFEEHWRLLTEQAYRYARAARAEDESGKQEAVEEMERLVAELGEYFSDLTGGLIDASALEEALRTNIEATTRAIGRQQHDENWVAALERAVETMKQPAALIAAGVAQDRRLQGEVDAEATTARVDLAAAMAGTAWYAALLTGRIVDGQPDAARQRARAVLDESTAALHEVAGRTFDPATADRLAALWAEHVERFEQLAEAVATEQDVAAIEANLQAWAADMGRLLQDATNGALDAVAMEHEAARHVETVGAVISVQAGRE